MPVDSLVSCALSESVSQVPGLKTRYRACQGVVRARNGESVDFTEHLTAHPVAVVQLMAEQHSVESGVSTLPLRVLKSLVRTARVRAGGAVLEVGPVRASAMPDWISLGLQPLALTDSAPSTPTAPGQVLIGDVAGGMPVSAHSVDAVILRTAKTFRAGLGTPEALLGAANLLSCLKPHGSLLVLGQPGESLQGWQDLLAAFPIKLSPSEYRDGLGWWLSLQWLKGSPQMQLPFLRAEIGKDALSRLQWHRLVRELIVKRTQAAAKAA